MEETVANCTGHWVQVQQHAEWCKNATCYRSALSTHLEHRKLPTTRSRAWRSGGRYEGRLSGRASSSTQRRSDRKRTSISWQLGNNNQKKAHHDWTYCVHELNNLGEPEEPGHLDHLKSKIKHLVQIYITTSCPTLYSNWKLILEWIFLGYQMT